MGIGPSFDDPEPGMEGEQRGPSRKSTARRVQFLYGALLASALFTTVALPVLHGANYTAVTAPINSEGILKQCHSLQETPHPPSHFNSRKQSDRFVHGTRAALIRNATIWTGESKKSITGNILLDRGIIKAVGSVKNVDLAEYKNLVVHDAGGAWVSPGLVDLHSHLGVMSAPGLSGAADTNSHKGPILPWLRSLDGLNTHDEAYHLTISGGVTTALVLPGSANAIGGQAFTIKLRPTEERSPTAMLLEPPFNLFLNTTNEERGAPLRWRQMKHACGRVYSATRMDTIWAFRQGYESARKIRDAQDDYCAKAHAGQWKNLGSFPHDLQWEALVDVLRGRVKVHTHCYETVDFAGLVGLTNEFKFPIAAFHHAHEAYLVPDVLKRAYGHPPAVAMFATNARYKRESFRGSEFAPKILADAGLPVVMKSDHPVLNSRHLVFEAQLAHYFGLPEHLALASVFSTPATAMGMDHRIGYIKKGYDADIVIWDSHPLSIGATPSQVFIDGIPQLVNPRIVRKPVSLQHAPKTPDFSEEAKEALQYEGLPPLGAKKSTSSAVVFTNVSSVFLKRDRTVEQVFVRAVEDNAADVIVKGGAIICYGMDCPTHLYSAHDAEWVNLYGGSVSPGLVSFGSPLGLEEITGEATTSDGAVANPLDHDLPSILGDGGIIKAQDGLMFSTRNALLAYESGITSAAVSPLGGFLSGVGAYFSTGAAHQLEASALIQSTAGVHLSLSHSSSSSLSSQISALRKLLLGPHEGERGALFASVSNGTIPLIINVHNADIMASLISLKKEVSSVTGTNISMVLNQAEEAHLLAKEIGEAGIGVILSPPRPYPKTWDQRRILPGPPLTQDSSLATLKRHGVKVAIGVDSAWMAHSTRFYTAWAGLEADGQISKAETIVLSSTALEDLLGIEDDNISGDMVATSHGTILDFESKVVAVASPAQGLTHFI